jgi:adenylate cyclase
MVVRVIAILFLVAATLSLTRIHFHAVTAWMLQRRHKDDEVFFGDCRRQVLNRMFRVLPSSPRCSLCFSPFGGVGPIIGSVPSRKNPKMCSMCFERMPIRGYQMNIGIFFADVRGFTSMASHTPDDQVGAMLNRFYRVATDVLVDHFAIIDKFMGDGVMALFLPAFPELGDNPCPQMLDAADDLLRAMGYGSGQPWLEVGVGLHYGHAQVGNVGAGSVKDFTAVGDAVNTASRLQGAAEGGTVLLSEQVVERLGPESLGDLRSITVKGKDEPLLVTVHDRRSAL